MANLANSAPEIVHLKDRLMGSAAFDALFREGMDMVEKTADYLDGVGREQSRSLDRFASLTYSTESMRLTTRLMQIASWLLLHRAVKEGEMSMAEANREKTKVKLTASPPGAEDMLSKLPEELQNLISHSMDLQAKVRRFDAAMHAEVIIPEEPGANPLADQLARLKAAFEN